MRLQPRDGEAQSYEKETQNWNMDNIQELSDKISQTCVLDYLFLFFFTEVIEIHERISFA